MTQPYRNLILGLFCAFFCRLNNLYAHGKGIISFWNLSDDAFVAIKDFDVFGNRAVHLKEF